MVDAVVPIEVLYVAGPDEGTSPIPGLERDGGLDVTVARGASEGRALLSEEFDCLLCAVELPDESGFEFCEHARANASVPVVMVGEDSAATLADQTLDAGGADYLPRTLLAASPALVGSRLRRLVDSEGDLAGSSPLDALPLPVVVGDERVHSANEAARETLGDGAELAGRRVDSLFELDDAITTDGEVRGSVAATGEDVVVRSVSLPSSPLDLTVALVDVVGTADDDRLLERANMLDSILANIPLAVYFKDRDGRHVAVSDFLPRMNPKEKVVNPEGKVHHTTEAIVGKTDFDLYPAELAEQTAEDEQEVIETGEPIINKTEYTYTPDQELMRLSTSKAPWYGPDGEVRGIVGITANITDEKRYEDTVDYQQNVLGLIQGVLEEPVTESIDELGEITEELPADEPASADLTDALDTVEEHVEVVDTLLREGQQQLGTELVDLERLARRSWNRQGTVEATMDVTYNGIIRADPTKVEQLFDELFENAVVHGGPGVHVTVEQFEDGFFVADDGPGIPPNERRHVFEYGYSTDDDAIGSGLTIAETVASSLGWELTIVESADGGCRFEVTGVTFE